MNEQPDNMSRIIKMFKGYDCTEDTLMSKQELSRILDTQAKNKLGRPLSNQIIQEIWGEAETNSRGQCTMLTFARIISNAIDILQSRLYRIDNS